MTPGDTSCSSGPGPGGADNDALEGIWHPLLHRLKGGFSSVARVAPLSVLFCIGAAGVANAQAGPTGVTPPAGAGKFSAEFGARASYASNISGGNSALAAIRKVEPSDLTYSLNTRLNFQLVSGRKLAFLTTGANVRRHDRNKILDGEDYQVSVGAGGQVGPCNGLVGASYARRQSLIEDLALPVATNVTEQPLGSVSLSCGRGALIGSLQGSIAKIQNDVKRPGFVDSDTKSSSVSIGYRNKAIGDVSLIAQYSKVNYSNATPSIPPSTFLGNQDFEQYGVGIQYSRKIGMRLSGTASVMATQLRSPGSKSSGVAGNAGLTYNATSRIQLSLDYDRSDQASILTNTSYLHAQSLNFKVNYRLSQRMSLSAGIRGSHDQYRGGVPSPLQIRDSKQLAENITGSLKIGRNVQMTLSGSHVDRKADVSIYDFTSDNVTLGITTQF